MRLVRDWPARMLRIAPGLYSLGIAVPGVVMLSEYTEVRAVKSMVRLSSPPHAQFAGISGSAMVPI